MRQSFLIVIVLATLVLACAARAADDADGARMAWWREARFGLFIHWGLYALPAGEWNGQSGHAEWIRDTAQIPVDEYDRFVARFNPAQFDADAWARLAKDAGMKYVVITSKHHDGFCLFDSRHTDYDVMSTPLRRDILRELADACRRQGLRICWYHSIMDWHHPDYLARRPWEAATRPAAGADFDRYVRHLHAQVSELLTNYGPIGVLWFDGEWEQTWNHDYGQPLYDLCRRLQPDVIVNNRVDKGRGGMAGMTSDAKYAGDFGTPEQEIPATGLPGVDWETCMTMNDHWGYNKADTNFKSTQDLVRKLCDIASKGGNFLLNVGPTAEGLIPEESVQRLREIGRWMDVNGEAIHGAGASPFKSLPWGRCTTRATAGGAALFLHVFDWPADGRLIVPGLGNEPAAARLLAAPDAPLRVEREESDVVIHVPPTAPDAIASVVRLDVAGEPLAYEAPEILAPHAILVDALDVRIVPTSQALTVRYTTDGAAPTASSPQYTGPLRITDTTVVRARCYDEAGKALTGVAEARFTRVAPRPAERVAGAAPGLRYDYYEGEWQALPDFDRLAPAKSGVVAAVTCEPRARSERFGFRFEGYLTVPRDGVYTLRLESDDGSRLWIGHTLLVDNDGLHSAVERTGVIALAAGAHPLRIGYFERTGDDVLSVRISGPGMEGRPLSGELLAHAAAAP